MPLAGLNLASLPFVKMHGLGNDFVIIDGRSNGFEPSEPILRAIANRRRGIGCDQVILLRKPALEDADIHMAIYNGDGSQVGACGNATRCLAKLLFEELGRKRAVIETVAGLLPVWEDPTGLVAVDFGKPRLAWDEIPLAHEADTIDVSIATSGIGNACCVSMGNPHAVFFVSNINQIALAEIGPRLEQDPLFLEKCNIEIAQVITSNRIRMRVWERGAGITEACGSGACATLVAAVRRGLSERRATLILDGGELIIEWREDGHVLMIGGASYSFKGVITEDMWR